MTLKDLIEHFESEYGLEVTMLSYGVSILFSFFQNKKKTQERMPLPMTQVHLVNSMSTRAAHLHVCNAYNSCFMSIFHSSSNSLRGTQSTVVKNTSSWR